MSVSLEHCQIQHCQMYYTASVNSDYQTDWHMQTLSQCYSPAHTSCFSLLTDLSCCLPLLGVEWFYWVHTSVFFRYTANMLMSNNVPWSMGKKYFHHCYGAIHKANSLRFVYIEDAVICVIICKTWTVSCLRCPIVTVKVLFPHWPLYVVRHQHVCRIMEEYGCAHSVKTLYCMLDQLTCTWA